MRNLEYSRDEEIADTQVGRPHIVIIGAGASRAAFPKGDRNGHRLPLMNDLVAVLDLAADLRNAGISPDRNFEEIYSELSELQPDASILGEIRQRVDRYFSALQIPDEPTIYDALVLSLRPKDLIATFNWDPFLFQACLRNHRVASLPRVAYLHGNVSIGYCLEHRTKGLRSSYCSICRTRYTPSRLLYPIRRKAYSSDPFIDKEWLTLERLLPHAFMLTIFGYGAPQSDVEAMDLMSKAWGDVNDRNLEQTELIDIRDDDDLRNNWSRFIHTHHYDIHRSFYDSWIAMHPRRSCEAAWQQYLEAKFVSTNPIPQGVSLSELQGWFGDLLAAELNSSG